jgi:hypothetical protein
MKWHGVSQDLQPINILRQEWTQKFFAHYTAHAQQELTPAQMAQLIHETLEIAEVRKYASEKSSFTLIMSGATEQDLAEIWQHLTPLEDLVVDLKCQTAK